MNNHQLPGIRLLYIICLFSSFSLRAQEKAPLREPDYNKPRLFNNLPASMTAEKQDLASIVSAGTQKAGEITLPLATGKGIAFSGKIVYANNQEEQGLRTVTIQSSNFAGAILVLSSLTATDGTTSFTGRIFSYQHGDAFELQLKNNQYHWIKKNLYEMMTE